jgi:hypothetical protein
MTVHKTISKEPAKGHAIEKATRAPSATALTDFADWFYSQGCKLNPTEVRAGVGAKLEEMGFSSPEKAVRDEVRELKRAEYPFAEGGKSEFPKPIVEGDDLG